MWLSICFIFCFVFQAEWTLGEERGVADALFAAQHDAVDENGNTVITDDNVRLTLQNLVVAGELLTSPPPL